MTGVAGASSGQLQLPGGFRQKAAGEQGDGQQGEIGGDFPVFNVADIFVTVSAVLLAVLLLLYYKEEDLEYIFHSRK